MKEIIEFTNDPILVEELFGGKRVKTFWNPSWVRVEIDLPNPYDNAKKICEWLEKNVTKHWASYDYKRSGKKTEHKMVLYFEDVNDALFFKLRGGHKAWELKD
jgi:hypothetical protein